MNSYGKVRLLVIHPALAPYRLDLFNKLAELFEMHLVLEHGNVQYQSFDQKALIGQLNFKPEFLGGGFSFFGRGIKFGIRTLIARIQPSIVVSHEFSPTTWQTQWVCRNLKVGHLVWTADSEAVIASENPARGLSRRLLLPTLDGLIVYTNDVARLYRSRFSFGGPIGVCANLQCDEAFRRRLSDSLPIARRVAQERCLHGKKLILFVGRLARIKRVDRLIRAFADGGALDDAQLFIVGEGDEYALLKELSVRLGVESSTHFLGHLEGKELLAWYILASVFVLPSEYEPWGAVVNEALMAGVNVICSEEVGAKSLITTGENGQLVSGDSVDEFRAALDAQVRIAPKVPREIDRLRKSKQEIGFSGAVDEFARAVHCVDGGR